MKNNLVFILLFFVGLISVFVCRIQQVKKAENIPFFAEESSFVPKPPSDAFVGKLLAIEGKVEKEPRDKEEFEKIEAGADIFQGEKLATGEKSEAEAEFPDFVRIKIGSGSEIGFINLIPANFLIEQKSGGVNYLLLQDDNPVSVRSLHVLLTFDSGEGQVIVEGEEITVKILDGQAKLALVDLENKTHVWQLDKNQKILINDAAKTVETGKL